MDFNSFINFDKMLTPLIIKIVFWIGAGISVIMGLLMFIDGGISVLMGLITIVVGPLVVRIYCELLIIMFKMHETLVDVKKVLENQPNNPIETE